MQPPTSDRVLSPIHHHQRQRVLALRVVVVVNSERGFVLLLQYQLCVGRNQARRFLNERLNSLMDIYVLAKPRSADVGGASGQRFKIRAIRCMRSVKKTDVTSIGIRRGNRGSPVSLPETSGIAMTA